MKENHQKKTFPQKVIGILTSYGLAVSIFVLMTILTLLGTLEQTERGIFDVQEAYFNSAYVIHWIGSIPILLPGGYLLMVLLFLNLLFGAIIKVRKDWRRPGLVISHFGILILLLGTMVSTHFKTYGYMHLFETQSSNEFVSFFDWRIQIAEVGEDGKLKDALVIPPGDLSGTRQDEQRTFTSEALPFDVVVNGYARNSRPLPVEGMKADSLQSRVVDGFVLEPRETEDESELNLPGAYVTIRGKQGGEEQETILWGAEQAPYTFSQDGKKWTIHLAKAKWQVPFEIRLDDAVGEWHPGSSIPRKFESHITKIENGVDEKVKIWMNHPLRHKGYTFFQRNFESGEASGALDQSVFDVVKNPADQWPLYSLIIVGIGMLVHFAQKLTGYVRKAGARRASAPASASTSA